MIDTITATIETFKPYVGQEFVVSLNEEQVRLLLDNVRVSSNAAPRDNHLEIDGVVHPPRQAFALTFEGPREVILEAMTHTLRNDQIGNIDLYLSPFHKDRDCMLYECVFN